MQEIIFTGVDLNQLLEKIGQLFENKLNSIAPQNKQNNQSKFITRKEVAKLLKITLPTLNEWTKLGWLQSYKIGTRVLYKEPEVIAAIDKLATYKFKKGGHHAA
ncbi:MAG: helix-turn-helix domain-containing protein [Bacteroidetes bacterium]|nr:helix-turn-helix domain-containing protein [Bacteroidota bacterium]